MKANKNEQILIYNGNKLKDKQAYAYAMALPNTVTRPVDVTKDSLTPRQIKEIANYMDCQVKDLAEHNEVAGLSENDLLTMLASDPEVWNTPITITREEGTFRKSPFEFIREQLKVKD